MYARTVFGERLPPRRYSTNCSASGCGCRVSLLTTSHDLEPLIAESARSALRGTTRTLRHRPFALWDKRERRERVAAKVQIDHIYQLAQAWDMGAARWPKQRRVDFANDQAANLLAVDGPANASKNDDGPGEWMPINRGYRCTLLRYLQVARSPHRSRDRGRNGCQGVNGPLLLSRSVRSVCVCRPRRGVERFFCGQAVTRVQARSAAKVPITALMSAFGPLL